MAPAIVPHALSGSEVATCSLQLGQVAHQLIGRYCGGRVIRYNA
jgi:hypothetical protein